MVLSCYYERCKLKCTGPALWAVCLLNDDLFSGKNKKDDIEMRQPLVKKFPEGKKCKSGPFTCTYRTKTITINCFIMKYKNVCI